MDPVIEKNILDCIPQQHPFLFIDGLYSVDEQSCTGYYTFKKEEFFYPAHFPDFPVTPGVILTECMAQIGLIPLGIFINRVTRETIHRFHIFFVSSNVNYYKPVFPGETVTVKSEVIYYRFKKLKCLVKMFNARHELVCEGELSGIFKEKEQ